MKNINEMKKINENHSARDGFQGFYGVSFIPQTQSPQTRFCVFAFLSRFTPRHPFVLPFRFRVPEKRNQTHRGKNSPSGIIDFPLRFRQLSSPIFRRHLPAHAAHPMPLESLDEPQLAAVKSEIEFSATRKCAKIALPPPSAPGRIETLRIPPLPHPARRG